MASVMHVPKSISKIVAKWYTLLNSYKSWNDSFEINVGFFVDRAARMKKRVASMPLKSVYIEREPEIQNIVGTPNMNT